MTTVDWPVVAFLIPLLLVPGFLASWKFRYSASERFTADRNLSWVVLGGSLAATSLSSDTPLLVSGAFYSGGLAGNWFWLAGIPGTLATLFFFARYWRRSGVLTKLEILQLRYGDSKETRTLRVIMAVLDAGLINVLILSSITLATHVLLESLVGDFGLSWQVVYGYSLSLADVATGVLVCLTVAYTLGAGFRAVVKTDMLQLTATIVASCIISYYAIVFGIRDFGSYANLVDQLPEDHVGFSLFVFEDLSVLLLLVFGWWQTAPGSGLFVQRFLSSHSEKDATLTALAFAILHYVVRAWPWYAIGALALVYFPGLDNSEQALPELANRFLPPGGVGVLIVAFTAAFMSTMDSCLNWGASYFVNDVFAALGGDRESATSRVVEILAVLITAMIALLLALTEAFTSILALYKYLMIIQSGAAFMAIARWYWWRASIGGEISGLICSFVIGNVLYFSLNTDSNLGFAVAIASNSFLSAAVSICFCIRDSVEGPSFQTSAFQDRVGVSGPGWRRCQSEGQRQSTEHFLLLIAAWLTSIVFVYSSIVAMASAITLNWNSCLVSLVFTTASAIFLRRRMTSFHLFSD